MSDMSAPDKILLYSILWAIVVGVTLNITLLSRHRTIGLPMAFLLNMTLNHCGALVHLDSNYQFDLHQLSWRYTADTVALGLGASFIGVLAFTIGIVIANRINVRARSAPKLSAAQWASTLPVSRFYLFVGVLAIIGQLILSRIELELPGAAAILGACSGAAIVGVCGYVVYWSLRGRRRRALLIAVAGAVILIFTTMMATGILADTVPAALIIVSFWFALFRPRFGAAVRALLLLSFSGYLIFIAAVTWLEVRKEIRSVVWQGGSISDRLNATWESVSHVNIFGNPQNYLTYMDARMDQNIFIGKAIERLQAFPSDYDNGKSIAMAFFGWVPRALWSNKPERGGNKFISYYTGLHFNKNTSFGTGPVFELFVNFGYPGIFLGMFVFGFLFRRLDIQAARALLNADAPRFGTVFLVATPMVTAMNSLFFIVNGAAAAWVVGSLIAFYTRRHWRSAARQIQALDPSRAQAQHPQYLAQPPSTPRMG
jgi:hypothetical protein